jgi:hypothetical protein
MNLPSDLRKYLFPARHSRRWWARKLGVRTRDVYFCSQLSCTGAPEDYDERPQDRADWSSNQTHWYGKDGGSAVIHHFADGRLAYVRRDK